MRVVIVRDWIPVAYSSVHTQEDYNKAIELVHKLIPASKISPRIRIINEDTQKVLSKQDLPR